MIAQFVAVILTSARDHYKCPELWYSGARCHTPTQRAVTPGFRPREAFARTGVTVCAQTWVAALLIIWLELADGPTLNDLLLTVRTVGCIYSRTAKAT
jgi:hypothetical protein